MTAEELKNYILNADVDSIKNGLNDIDFDINQHIDNKEWNHSTESMNSEKEDYGYENKSFLHLAIERNNPKIISLVLKIKDIDLNFEYVYYSYYRTSSGGFFSSVNISDSEEVNKKLTSAEFACEKGNYNVALLLLEAGSQIRADHISTDKLLNLLLKMNAKGKSISQEPLIDLIKKPFENDNKKTLEKKN